MSCEAFGLRDLNSTKEGGLACRAPFRSRFGFLNNTFSIEIGKSLNFCCFSTFRRSEITSKWRSAFSVHVFANVSASCKRALEFFKASVAHCFFSLSFGLLGAQFVRVFCTRRIGTCSRSKIMD